MNATISQTRPPARLVDPQGPLMLRAPTVQDAPALVDAIQASLPALRAFMPWSHLPQTVDAQYARLADVVAAYWKGEDYIWHIAHPDRPGVILGCMGLHRRAMNRRALELGYWVRTDHAGRGICTRAARMIVVLAVEHFGCRRVQCGFDTANAASGRVGAKAGFEVEGDLKGYGPAGDAAMRAAGWAADDVNRMTALDPTRARAQPWYGPLAARMQLWDWRGERLT